MDSMHILSSEACWDFEVGHALKMGGCMGIISNPKPLKLPPFTSTGGGGIPAAMGSLYTAEC